MYDHKKSPTAPVDITACFTKGTGVHPLGFYGQRQNISERVNPIQYGDTKLLMQRDHSDCIENCMYKAFAMADQYDIGSTFCSNPAVVAAYMEKNKIVLPATTVKPRQEVTIQPTSFLPSEFKYKSSSIESVTEKAIGIFRNYVATPISKLVRN
jgi:hypothetical protein